MRDILAKNIMELMRSFLEEDPDDSYMGNYVGIVENNKDPEKIGRCQIRIYGIHDDIPTESLQWVEPDVDLAAGLRGSFIVPEIGTSVNMYFNKGDIYQPRYFGKAIDKTTNGFLADKDEDYPDTFILYETRKGDYLKVNRFRGEFTLHTAAGCTLRMSQNGDIDIENSSSNNGDMSLTLLGNFKIDNRKGNTTLLTSNCSVSAFGNIDIKSNSTVDVDSLGSNTIKTNKSFEVLASDRATLKSQHSIRTESNETQMRSNVYDVAPAVSGTFTYGFCSALEQMPSITVIPQPFGGPFNCIPFDPLTGMPHQGRIVTGSSFLISDLADRTTEIIKQTTDLTKLYAQKIIDKTSEIARKYASLDMQAQLIANAIGSTSISSTQATEISDATLTLNKELKQKIKDLQTEYNSFLTKDIYKDEQDSYDAYIKDTKNHYNTAFVDSDITGKTTIKDIVGCGKGLVNDD